MNRVDVAIIGGGIVGLATALAILRRRAVRLVVLEAEPELSRHQTGRNSGVIHSGIYYKPGSQKALLCSRGRELLMRFCDEHDLACRTCGKLIVATHPRELPRLDELARRAGANGLSGVRRLSQTDIREIEPHVAGIAGLWVPHTAVIDFAAVAAAMAREAGRLGAEIRTSSAVASVADDGGRWTLRTGRGDICAKVIVNCAGLQADRVAMMCGEAPEVRLIPFKGEYFELAPEAAAMLRHPVYPVPDPAMPFLGVHFTPTIRGSVEVGPNALLCLDRHGYEKASFDPREARELFAQSRTWLMMMRHLRAGAGELLRSISPSLMIRALRRLLPSLKEEHLRLDRARCGIRAQAVSPGGRLLDDFVIHQSPRAVHVINAPSPAATASLAIGEHIADLACARLA